MNILEVSQNFDIRGGSDVIVHQTQKLLQKSGHDVHLFAALDGNDENDGTFPSADHFNNPSPLNLWKYIYSPQARSRMENFLDQNPIDVAHFHIYYGKLTSSIIAPLRKRNIPIVQHLHEYRTYCSTYTSQRDGQTCLDCSVGSYLPGLKNRCNRGSLARSALSTAEMYVSDFLGAKSAISKFVTVSDFQRQQIIKQGLPASKVQTIYNPVDDVFLNIKAGKRENVLYFGRIEDYKGVFDILDVAERLPDHPFQFVGTGNSTDKLIQEIKSRNLTNVTYLGHKDKNELLPILSNARVALVPSKWHETFGLTAVEAMAAGVPVIVSNMGGLPEVAGNNEGGFIFDMGDTHTLAKLIQCLMDDDVFFNKQSSLARTRVQRMFTEDTYLAQISNLLADGASSNEK